MSMEDKFAIQELNLRYALHIDLMRVEPWVDTFTADAVFDEREFDFGIHVGHEQIRAYGEAIVANAHKFVHVMTNHLVTDVADDRAKGTVYGIAEGVSLAGERTRYHVVYEDEYRKIGGEWKISSRVVHPKLPPEIVRPGGGGSD